jgi:hypothetical protein
MSVTKTRLRSPPPFFAIKPSSRRNTSYSKIIRLLPYVAVLCIASIVIWIVWPCDHYMSYPPANNQICGIWVIDKDRTTWSEALPLLRNGTIGPQRGHLEIKPGGRFFIEDLPAISLSDWYPVVPCKSVSGNWWTNIGIEHHAYLLLDYKIVNGELVEGKNTFMYFRNEGKEYILFVIIGDPGSGDELVFRKKK